MGDVWCTTDSLTSAGSLSPPAPLLPASLLPLCPRSLSPVQLSQTVLHLGRTLVQPVHTDRRQRLREHNR